MNIGAKVVSYPVPQTEPLSSDYTVEVNGITIPVYTASTPVSYTHLDVYKRQQESRRIPVRFVGDESVKRHRPLPLSCPQAGREVKQEDY